MLSTSPKNILFLVSGSISCYKSAFVISQLVQKGHRVKVASTPSALKFVGEATFEGLSHNPVFKEIFNTNEMMSHIHLAQWADIFVLCPATANTINKLALGLADDLVSTLALAKERSKQFLIFLAMNEKMYQHPATQNSIKTLLSWGHKVFETNNGPLACGDVGEGRLLEPSEIIKHIEDNLSEQQPSQKILITSGATREKLDDVRYISNISTGQTGSLLAEYFIEHGHDVTYVHAQNCFQPRWSCTKIHFTDFKNLDLNIKKALHSTFFDVAIHLAAVSDYSVDSISQDNKNPSEKELKKLSSQKKTLVHLKTNHKILNKIRDYSLNKEIKIVGFKLTNTDSESEKISAVKKIFKDSPSDFLVHNDMSQLEKNNRFFRVFNKDLSHLEAKNVIEMARHLEKLTCPTKKKNADVKHGVEI